MAMQTTASSRRLVSVLAHEGDYWTIVFQGRVSRIRNIKGLHYLSELLRRPGEELHALALAWAIDPPPPGDKAGDVDAEPLTVGRGTDGGPVLDSVAVAAYRRRFRELQDELADAEQLHDDVRAALAREELHAFADQLAEGLGLGGRYRRAGSASERARLAVTKAIRAAVRKIESADPVLGRHLHAAVRTGTYCQYLPDPTLDVVWTDGTPGPPRPAAPARRTCRPQARARCRRAF